MDFKAQLRSAAWGLASAIGYADAIKFLETVLSELKDAKWNGR